MPISDDEFDSNCVQEPRITMSKAEMRKTHKPIMEKRRRARINQCLNEIKSLVLEALNKDPSRHSKLEKADILEMAVKHLQNVQRQQLAIAMATDPSVVRKFKAGFNDCAEEIDKCLNQMEGVGNSVKHGLSGYLKNCINRIEQIAQVNMTERNHRNTLFGNQPNNDNADRDDGYFTMPHFLPERMRPGDLTLLLSNVTNNFNFSNRIPPSNTSRPSAFATVIPSSTSIKLLSPPLSPKVDDEQQGFRPVKPIIKPVINYEPPPLKVEDDPQICQISSTSTYITKATPSYNKFPARIIEPLCVITNQNERFKQAHVVEETRRCEENQQRGVKRKFDGLLTTAKKLDAAEGKKNEPSSSSAQAQPSDNARQRNDEPGTEMWRPW